MKKNRIKLRACTMLVVGFVFASLFATSCYVPEFTKTPPAQKVSHFGTSNSHWLMVRINPVSGDEKQRLRHYVICRFLGERNWVVKLNGNYSLYTLTWNKYDKINIDADFIKGAYDTTKEPCCACKVGEKNARLIDVDALKTMFPVVDMIVVDDGKVGFLVEPPNTLPLSTLEYITLRGGGGDLIKETSTMALLLQGM